MPRAVADHVVARERRAVLERDDRLDRHAEHRIGHADDRRLADAGERVEDVLDLLRAHLLAARLDDVVLAADEIEKAVVVGAEKVAGVEHLLPGMRAGLQRPVGRRLVLPVALHDVRPADDELADHAGRDALAVVVDDVGLGVRNGDADRARTALEARPAAARCSACTPSARTSNRGGRRGKARCSRSMCAGGSAAAVLVM